MPGTVSEGPTVSMSFANNFWGKDDAGVHPMLDRMHNAKVTCDELKAFYNARAAIEDDYARKLLSLCRKPLGSSEIGTLRASLDVVRGEVEAMAKAHAGIASQMKTELEEPLAAFAGGMKERRKIVQTGVEKLLKTKIQQTQAVTKHRDRYEQDCLRIKGYLAQGHMVMGQEERRNKAKLEKTQIQMASASNEYEAAVKVLEETTGRWNKEWKAACDKFQDLEEERLDFTKSSLWSFANIASTVCVSDDTSCEKVRLSLENCEVEKDITGFIRESGTGQEIPDAPKYINFARGDLGDTASEDSEDENYQVAQFQRSINPAFRSSSPQPSTYESHHDPDRNPTFTPPSRERTMTPQTGRSQGQAPPGYQPSHHGDIAQVPHNEYPTDGMTMFCRTGPPSDLSSARPGSSDSHSEYSNPTSYSSQDPASGKQSPVKLNNPPAAQAMGPDKAVAKKRSGFFSNSPFRRKSKHEKEPSHIPNLGAPASRNTWAPTSRNGGGHQSSPTKIGFKGPTMLAGDRRSGSPDPVDPRANFQLNVGNNVFDVASPDRTPRKTNKAPTPQEQTDPIAQALAELKGLDKQSSVRMSVDRYAGVATPAPGAQAPPPLANPNISGAQRGTPPPSYNEPPAKRLDAPQPAFTSAQMQQTTRKYTGQTQEMFGTNSRPGTRDGHNVPRATSPAPPRAASPRPGIGMYQSNQHRPTSPNPYGSSGRPRAGTQSANTSPTKRGSGQGGYHPQYSRHNSPNDPRRAPSPQPPQFARPDRPSSSGGMEVQLAHSGIDMYGSQRGAPRGQSQGRPMSYYGGQPGGGDMGGSQGRSRSKSMADPRQFTRDGRQILHFARAMYSYTAAIPEELSFNKGDVLAVLRLQDDGWWEAEVTGKRGRPGLVPSNYLQNC